jgi:hypothetical protein
MTSPESGWTGGKGDMNGYRWEIKLKHGALGPPDGLQEEGAAVCYSGQTQWFRGMLTGYGKETKNPWSGEV